LLSGHIGLREQANANNNAKEDSTLMVYWPQGSSSRMKEMTAGIAVVLIAFI
jgi:hypothetical protein